MLGSILAIFIYLKTVVKVYSCLLSLVYTVAVTFAKLVLLLLLICLFGSCERAIKHKFIVFLTDLCHLFSTSLAPPSKLSNIAMNPNSIRSNSSTTNSHSTNSISSNIGYVNRAKLSQLLERLNQVILDKPQVVKLAVVCLLAEGHLLLQDLPGMGKTTLSHALAKLLGLDFNRVQFTNDMLPADILGMNIYNQSNMQFDFRKGPIFTQILLADEINRSSPKTQSALLEAMEGRLATVPIITHHLSA